MGAGRWADACRTTAQSTGGWPAVQLNNVCVCVCWHAGATKYRWPKNRPRRTLSRNKFAGGEHIPGENPPGEENYVAPPPLK